MNSIRKNFFYNAGYQLLTILIPIVTTPYLARVIGAEGIGKYSYANSIAYYFVMFIMLGLNNYGNRTIASVRNDKKELSKTFCEIFSMQVTFGFVLVLAYIVFSYISGDGGVLRWIMLIYVVSAMIDVNWLFFGLEKFQFTVTRNTLIKILTTILIFLCVKSPSDLYLYVLIILSGTLLSNIVLWPVVFKTVSSTKVTIFGVLKHVKPNLTLFIPIIAVSIYKYMDKIMLGHMSSMQHVGFYESSEKIIQVPIALVKSLGTVMLPKMSNLVANNKNQEEKRYISNSIIFAMFVSSSLCFGLMGIAEEFVPIFYGAGYDTCVDLFYVLLPSCIFIAFANVVRTQYLIPHKFDIIYIKSVLLGAIVNLIINIVLIPQFHSVGAAIGTLIAEAVVCIFQVWRIREYLPTKLYVKNSIPFVISGGIMFVVLILIPPFLSSLYLRLFFKIFIGSLIYFSTLFIAIQINKERYRTLIAEIKDSNLGRKIMFKEGA